MTWLVVSLECNGQAVVLSALEGVLGAILVIVLHQVSYRI